LRKQVRVPLVDLVRQYERIKDEIDSGINRVVNSGRFILGEEVDAFEAEFARYLGTKQVIGVGSGTDALRLAIRSLGIGKGDEVITVPNTFVSTVDAILLSGAKPILADIEFDSYTIDPAQVEARITPRTKAIIVVHMYGLPCDMDGISELVQRHGLKLVEDVAQAAGATFKGQKIGSFGDLSCFSFYPTKNLGAYGDGGAVATNNEELAQQIRMLRNYGQRVKNVHDVVGHNSRLDEIQAAILRAKLGHLDIWNKMRRENARKYEESLSNVEGIVTPDFLNDEKRHHVYHIYAIRCLKRDELKNWLEKRGISTQVHYPRPVHLIRAYGMLGYETGDFPGAEMMSKIVISLPMFPELTNQEIEYVCNEVHTFLKK